MNKTTTSKRWQFWIDRGGTFTDVVAKKPNGKMITRKFLSDSPEHYEDATLHAIHELLEVPADEPLPLDKIESVKMGTTLATNALLQRRGEATVLAITKGFADALRIGYQDRPRIFDRHIVRPEPLYDQVIEVEGRLSASGQELEELDLEDTQQKLKRAHECGIRSCAIVLMHGYCYPQHEQKVAELANSIGFSNISVSHQVSPSQKLISRGETTVVDAYLSPVIRHYIEKLEANLGQCPQFFMQSNGGLCPARNFRGKDSILSGPAGGIIGAVKMSASAGVNRIIAFDMGGTSTDVSLYRDRYERCHEATIAGARMRVPMMDIHTIAAGGGSICRYQDGRYRVGPDSAGASPGPACYRRGGPLTLSDCNVQLGRLQAEFFPPVFGPTSSECIDTEVVHNKFRDLAQEIHRDTGTLHSPDQIAEGFLRIAIEKMAHAIKAISIQKGHHTNDFSLCCFGGAGAQHVCQVADVLEIQQIVIPPYAGVLSALGIGLADLRLFRRCFVGKKLDERLHLQLANEFEHLSQSGVAEMHAQLDDSDDSCTDSSRTIEVQKRIHLHYLGSDSTLELDFCDREQLVDSFTHAHQRRYGFSFSDKELSVASLTVEVICTGNVYEPAPTRSDPQPSLAPIFRISMYAERSWHDTPVYSRRSLQSGDSIEGPAMIEEDHTTIIVEPGWRATNDSRGHLILRRDEPLLRPTTKLREQADPMLLELFNNVFMSVAEQMGNTLANTAQSVNIKERLDFSCALFDRSGDLIANAPHMPVHLGSMGDSVKAVIQDHPDMRPGDVFGLNAPYRGGTHLPDLTVVTPVFGPKTPLNRPAETQAEIQAETQAQAENTSDTPLKSPYVSRDLSEGESQEVLFFLASRGHHADIGGISPGSMPAQSRSIEEEGVMIDNLKFVDEGHFQEQKILQILDSAKYPARNPPQNIADIQAQIAANMTGVREMYRIIDRFGLEIVLSYMKHIQDYAEACVRRALSKLHDGTFTLPMDDGSKIEVSITVDHDHRQALVNFEGTSPQHPGNFNAPRSICSAAVLYVFRSLIEEEIPLNAGCLRPVTINIPEKSLLTPQYPAAVVAGNVETSQAVTDALYGALGVLAASQGTMNNFTFGNDQLQYYETIAGGSGAGPSFHGCSAVQTHMTNSRLTDPEVLEWRFPVIVQQFAIRLGSGGDGRYRGGDGVVRRIQFTQSMRAEILANRRKIAPFGLNGGSAGQCGRSWVERVHGQPEILSSCARVEMQPGDVFVIETPGGGGFGAIDEQNQEKNQR